MVKKLNKILSPKLEVRQRLFQVILLSAILVGIAALIAGTMLSNSLINTMSYSCLLLIMAAIFIGTIKDFHVEGLMILFGILLICIVFPVMFFFNGGIKGGASVWFVLGILYIFMMFSGETLIAFLALAVFMDIATYAFAYVHTEWILEFQSRIEVYYDSLFAVLAVGISTGTILHYQVSMLREAREVTARQKEEIEEISASKDMFFANMSHEIRTPINTINGLSEMILRETDLTSEIEEDAFHIRKASEKLIELVNELLDLSQIESRRMELVCDTYKTEDLFLEIIDGIRMRTEQKKLKFYINIDENLPSALYGDKKRIQQVLLNLLTNAVKYTEKGSVTFRVNGEKGEDGQFFLKVSVEDTGIGIKKEDLEKLFDPFRRLELAKNAKVEGNGLGLSIAKQLLDLMGGAIMVDSVYRNGSVFTASIPQQILDAKPIGNVDYEEGISVDRKHYERSFEAPEARILVVDDDKNNLMVTKKLLRETRVQIDCAESGEECLAKTELKYYQLILLDHMMPGMDGIETLEQIRKQENGMCREVPVIALTANASVFDSQNYMDYGFDGYLEKPVEAEHLEAEILKYIPEDLIEYRRKTDTGETVQNGQMLQTNYRRKRMLVTSDCVCDLPETLLEKYDIRLIYLYVQTANGCFQDTKEIDSNNFSRYLSASNGTAKARAVSTTVEEYEDFFAGSLREAEEVIHISLAKYAGKSYENAAMAAEGFDHVHIIDSGQVSCGEGLLVLYAADMAKKGYSYTEIEKRLERVKGKIQTSFLLPSADFLYANGYIDKMLYKIFDKLEIHPVIQFKKSRLMVHSIWTGRMRQARKRYMGQSFFLKSRVNYDVACITHVGCSVIELREIREELKKYGFKKIIVHKASVSSACNSGLGTIGIAYMTKMRNDGKDSRR